jgi:predicted anti-sigma-YlaC factor YlaD
MKQKLVGVFTVTVIFLTTFQGLIPTLPFGNQAALTIVSAVTMYLVTAITIWKQILSKQIDDAAKWPTIIVGIIATIGGLNDLFSVVPISEILGQWLRFGITFIVMFLNVLSKVLWPTPETKSTL